MILSIAVGAALLAGFLTGFLCFKNTHQFCGRCGITRECPVCGPEPARPQHESRLCAGAPSPLPVTH